MEYYCQSYKRNELSGHGKTWENLKCTLLSKGRLSEKATYCMILFILHSRKGKKVWRH